MRDEADSSLIWRVRVVLFFHAPHVIEQFPAERQVAIHKLLAFLGNRFRTAGFQQNNRRCSTVYSALP
jgi:hypothetical protein